MGLYREPLRELETQHDAGTLDAVQLEAGRLDAARDLLDDAQGPEHAAVVPWVELFPWSRPCRRRCWHCAVPNWGSLDQLMLARQHARHSAQSIEKITTRLEALLAATPE